MNIDYPDFSKLVDKWAVEHKATDLEMVDFLDRMSREYLNSEQLRLCEEWKRKHVRSTVGE